MTADVVPEGDRRRLNDADIRAALRAVLVESHAAEPDTVLVEELGLRRGEVRLDIAVVNGLMHGYEIKSDRDSLRRLAVQVDVYGKFLDRATLVVGERYRHVAAGLVPDWWGLMVAVPARTGVELVPTRGTRANTGRDARALVELLWLSDVMALLAHRGGERGYRGKPRRIVWQQVCSLYSIDEIATAARRRLKTRAAQ